MKLSGKRIADACETLVEAIEGGSKAAEEFVLNLARHVRVIQINRHEAKEVQQAFQTIRKALR